MKPPIIRYTSDQLRAIALLDSQPLTRDELLAHFPARNKSSLAAMLRTPMQTGKVCINQYGKYQIYERNESGLKVIKGRPQPFSPPLKYEFLYEVGTLTKDF